MSADATGQGRDWTLVYDTSTGRTKKAALSSVFLGGAPTKVIGFYGETGVDQGTMTATAVTALASITISAANAVGVYGFSSSTVAKAYVKRLSQIQADVANLINKVESTGLIAVSGN